MARQKDAPVRGSPGLRRVFGGPGAATRARWDVVAAEQGRRVARVALTLDRGVLAGHARVVVLVGRVLSVAGEGEPVGGAAGKHRRRVGAVNARRTGGNGLGDQAAVEVVPAVRGGRRHAADEVVVVGAAFVGAEVLAARAHALRADPARQARQVRSGAGSPLLGAAGRPSLGVATVIDEIPLADAVAAGDHRVVNLGTVATPAGVRVALGAGRVVDRVVGTGRQRILGRRRAAVPERSVVEVALVGADLTLGNAREDLRVVVWPVGAGARVADQTQLRAGVGVSGEDGVAGQLVCRLAGGGRRRV